jgi:hypothetical protein
MEINNLKIDNWIDELEQERKKLYDSLKLDFDKNKQSKIECIQTIQTKLRNYKQILKKEIEDKKKF